MPNTLNPSEKEQFLAKYTGQMFLTLTFGLMTLRVGRRVLPPLLPAIIEDLNVGPAQAGLVLSVGSVCFALMQYPSGHFSDHLTRKTVILASLCILLVGYLILLSTPTYGILLIGSAVVGIGEGLFGPADRALLADLFHERRGLAFGVHTAASDLGGIVAAFLAVGVVSIATWNTAFLPVIISIGIVTFFFYRWGREAVFIAYVQLDIRENVNRLLENPYFIWLSIIYSLWAFSVQGVTGFLPTLLQTDRGFSFVFASGSFAILFATGLVARPTGGWLSDRFPRLYIGAGGIVFSAVGLLILVKARSTVFIILGIIIFAGGQKLFPPAIQAYLMDSFPDSSMGGDLGATRAVYISVASLGPAFVGYTAGVLSYTHAFMGLLGFLVIAACLMVYLSTSNL